MFHFLNRWRLLFLRDRTADVPADPEDKLLVRLLVITQDDNFFLSIHSLLTGCGWETRVVRTVERGLQMLDEFPASVAIYDWPANGKDWRIDVDRLTARPDYPCVLLASPVDDEYLGAELVRHGGFDVIPRSAEAERFVRTIQFAFFFKRNTRNTVRGGGRSFVR
jgi:hypothetical protein